MTDTNQPTLDESNTASVATPLRPELEPTDPSAPALAAADPGRAGAEAAGVPKPANKGRPKGSKRKKRRIVLNAEKKKAAAALAAIPQKKGRGRPAKAKPAGELGNKAKRGRPKKLPEAATPQVKLAAASPSPVRTDSKPQLAGVLKSMAQDFKREAPQPSRTVTLRIPDDLYNQMLADVRSVGARSLNAFLVALYRKTRGE